MWRHFPGASLMRALRALPWRIVLRLRQAAARVADPEALQQVACLPGSAAPLRGGCTWMPALGVVRWDAPLTWTLDQVSGHDFGAGRARGSRRVRVPWGAELLRCWSRARLTDVWHAALVAATRDDEAAARHVGAVVKSFAAHAAPGRGLLWSSAMEVGLRAVRLLHAAEVLAGARSNAASGRACAAALDEVLPLLGAHESWLDAHSDWRGPWTGNHQLVALAARAVLACRLPGRATAAATRDFWSEFRRQVLPDGLHFESATGYHLLAAEAAAHVVAAGRVAGQPPDVRSLALLQDMLGATLALARPDGTLPRIGDADDCRFLELPPSAAAPREADAGAVLALLARAAGRRLAPGVAAPAALAAADWLFGTRDADEGVAPSLAPALFLDGGLAVLAARRADGSAVHACVSATGAGRDGTGGHAHDDAGAYDLWCGGPLVTSRGTRCYFESRELRQLFRGTAAHSVVQVDGLDQNGARPDTPFRRRERARASVIEFSDAGGGRVAVGHHGFATAVGHPTVLRRVALEERARLVVEDEVGGSGVHDLALRIHWAPGLQSEPRADGAVVLRGSAVAARINVSARSRDGQPLRLAIATESTRHSPRFGEDVEATVMVVRLRAELPLSLLHEIRMA